MWKEEMWPREKEKLSVEVPIVMASSWVGGRLAAIKVTQQAKIELAAHHRHNFGGHQLNAAAAGLATVIVCLLSPIIAHRRNLSLFNLTRCNS